MTAKRHTGGCLSVSFGLCVIPFCKRNGLAYHSLTMTTRAVHLSNFFLTDVDANWTIANETRFFRTSPLKEF